MKIFSKVDEIWLILFRIFHWSFLWSPFWSFWSHLRINWQKLSKNPQKSPYFGVNLRETGTEIEKSGADRHEPCPLALEIIEPIESIIFMAKTSEHKLKLVKNRKSPIFCVGAMKNFFKPTFLDVFFDADSESVLGFAFGASGSELWPFFWFWPLHRAIFLSLFFKKWKKKSQKWLQIGLSCSEFFTDHFYEVHFGLSSPTYAKIGKNGRKIPKNRPTLGSFSTKLGLKSKNRL